MKESNYILNLLLRDHTIDWRHLNKISKILT